ncbi:MAG: pitrilysin family protein [Mollicutes bacterium]|nr:pitrilysin family protein [Mollicutes bacterium]
MQVINKDLGSYNLHFIKTDIFKTITMKVIFHTPIIKEDITKRNILSDILLQSTKEYKTRRDLTIKSEDLYAADIYTSNQRVGNYIMTSFILQTLNDKYTEENNFEESIKFLHEIIFNPDVEEERFKEDKLELVKSNATLALNSIKEDATNYSLIRMSEAYDKTSPISYRMTGYLEDLDKITEENLYEYYERMLDNDYVDIFILGDINEKELLPIIKKYFKFKKVKKRKASYYLPNKKPRKRRLFAKETTKNSQSKLAIACPITKMTDYEKNYSLLLANIILGGTGDSKLFKEVREENSLCYTIRSNYNRLDNLMVINAGIDNVNFDKAVELITKNIQDMKKGKFTDSDINVAKEFYKTSAESLMESPSRIINEVLTEEILGVEPLSERVRKIEKVTKKDIMRACKKINMDTVFLLEGGNK